MPFGPGTNFTPALSSQAANYSLGVGGASSIIVQTVIGGALSRTIAYAPTDTNGFNYER